MKCELCGHEDTSAKDLEMSDDIALMLNHLRLMHPEYGEPERWSDGSLVLHDDTLTPEDFT